MSTITAAWESMMVGLYKRLQKSTDSNARLGL